MEIDWVMLAFVSFAVAMSIVMASLYRGREVRSGGARQGVSPISVFAALSSIGSLDARDEPRGPHADNAAVSPRAA
jgi:hypothetical protein